MAPWGKAEEAMRLGEQETVPELGREVGARAGAPRNSKRARISGR